MRTCARVTAFVLSSALAVACDSDNQETRIRAAQQADALPSWAVPYGLEPWHARPSALSEIAQRSAHATESLDRASHVFTITQQGTARLKTERYSVEIVSRRIRLSEGTTTAEIAPARMRWGDQELAAAATDGIALGNTVQSALGNPGVVEHVEARANGLEVTWVFANRRDDGDLNITLPFTGALVHSRPGTTVANVFTMSDAVLVDANGERTRLDVASAPGALVITASAAMLSKAAFPIAIDPTFSPTYVVFAESSSNARVQSPVAAALPTRTIVAWWQPHTNDDVAASARGDLNTVIMRSAGTGDDAAFMVSPTVRTILPLRATFEVSRIAAAATEDRFVVAWYDRANARINAILTDGDEAIDSTAIRTIATNAADSPYAIACNGLSCLLIWRSSAQELRARLLDAQTLGASESDQLVAAAPSQLDITATASTGGFIAAWAPLDATAIQGFTSSTTMLARTSFTIPTSAGTLSDVRTAFDGNSYFVAFLRSTPDSTLSDGFARTVIARRVSLAGQAASTDILCSGARVDARHLSIAGRDGSAVVLYSDATKYVRSASITGGSSVTQGENVDYIGSAESIVPQIVATGLSSPIRFHAVWAFNGPSETGIDWPYDARARDLSLVDAAVTNTATIDYGEGGIYEFSHLVDPSMNNGFNTWVGAARNGSDFLVTWSSDHAAASTIKGSIIRHDGTLATPNGISIPAQTGYAYDRAKAIPIYEGGWQLAYQKHSADGGVVSLSEVASDGATLQTTDLTQPGFVFGALEVAYGFGDNAIAWKGSLASRSDEVSVALLTPSFALSTVNIIRVSGSVGTIGLAAGSNGFILAYTRSDVSGSDKLCYRVLARSSPTTMTVGSEVIVPVVGALSGATSQVRAFGGADGEYMLVWNEVVGAQSRVRLATTTSGVLNTPTLVHAGNPTVTGLYAAQAAQSRLVSWSTQRDRSTSTLQGVTTQSNGTIFNAFGLPGIVLASDTRFAGATSSDTMNEWLLAYTEFEHSSSFYGDRVVATFVRTDHLDPDDHDDDGLTPAEGDCSDANPNTWTSCSTCTDSDGDGYWIGCDTYATVAGPDCDDSRAQCAFDCFEEDRDGDGITAIPVCGVGNDCDDDDPLTYASAPEICDGRDNDCNQIIDEVASIDADGDGYLSYCSTPPAEAVVDCDDLRADRYPGASERCDARDNDCDGIVDEGFALLGQPCFAGVGECSIESVYICSSDGSGVLCRADSGMPSSEYCDLKDNDCDGEVDEICGSCSSVNSGHTCTSTGSPVAYSMSQDGSFTALNGKASVDAYGNFTYTIPLKVLPGRADLAPELAVIYNSVYPSGTLGAGWYLQGLSEITRCGWTTAEEGSVRTVRFDENDRLCMDGARLVPVENDFCLWPKREFAWRRDSTVRVCAVPQEGASQFATFEAHDKTGVIRTYGGSDNIATIHQNGSVVNAAWPLMRATDRYDNYIEYTYEREATTKASVPLGGGWFYQQFVASSDSPTYLIHDIKFTGHNSSDVPKRQIEFIYELRPDVVPAYDHGYPRYKNRRLAEVREHRSTSPYTRYYKMHYDGGRHHLSTLDETSLLTGIEECATTNGGSKCLPITEFQWNDSATTLSLTETAATSLDNLDIASAGYGYAPLFIDYDRDGLTELVDRYRIFSPTGAGGFTVLQLPEPIAENYRAALTVKMDVNRDGLQDIVNVRYDRDGSVPGEPIWVRFTTQSVSPQIPKTVTSIETSRKRAWAVDLTGDGFEELVLQRYDGVIDLFGTYNSTLIPITLPRTDCGAVTVHPIRDTLDASFRCYSGANYRTINVTESQPGVFSATVGQPHAVPSDGPESTVLADINGDGLADVITISAGKVEISIYDGKYLMSIQTIKHEHIYPLTGAIGDWNGDRAADLPYVTWGSLYGVAKLRLFSLGTNGEESDRAILDHNGVPIEWAYGTSNPIQAYLQDLNSDDITDLILFDGLHWRTFLRNGPGTRLITRIFDGYQATSESGFQPTIEVTYRSSKRTSPTPATESCDPGQRCESPATNIVDKITFGGNRSLTYNYSRPRAMRVSGEFGGWGTIKIEEVARSRRVEVDYALDKFDLKNGFYEKGQPSTIIERTGLTLQRELRTSVTTTATFVPSRGDTRTRRQQLKTQLSDSYSNSNKFANTSQTEETTFDDYGNALSVQRSRSTSPSNMASLRHFVLERDLFHSAPVTESITNAFSQSVPREHRLWGWFSTTSVERRSDTGSKFLDNSTPPTGHPLTSATTSPTVEVARFRTEYEYGDHDEESSKEFDADGILSREVQKIRDEYGNVTSLRVLADDGSSIETRIEYDAAEHIFPTARHLPSGTQLEYYDRDLGSLTASIGPDSIAHNFQYNRFGETATHAPGDGTIRRTSRAAAAGDVSYVATTEGADGNQRTLRFDRYGRVIAVVDKLAYGSPETVRAASTFIEYDALGRVIRQSAPTFGTSPIEATEWFTTTYDFADRPLTFDGPRGLTTFVYNNNVRTTIDKRGYVVDELFDSSGVLLGRQEGDGTAQRMYYNANGRLWCTEIESSGTDAYNGELKRRVYTAYFDQRGRISSVRDVNNAQYNYGYDGFDRIRHQIDPIGNEIWVTYDPAGHVTSRQTADAWRTYVWGAKDVSHGKIVRAESSDGVTSRFTYAPQSGLLASRVLTVAPLPAVAAVSVEYDYTYQNGKIASMTLPALPGLERSTVNYGYGSDGALAEIRDSNTGTVLWTAYERNARSKITRHGNHAFEALSDFDVRSDMQTRATVTATEGLVHDFVWERGPGGNIEASTEKTGPSGPVESRGYGYSDPDALVSVLALPGGSSEESYDYDSLGNLRTRNPDISLDYETGSTRLIAAQYNSTAVNIETNDGGALLNDGRRNYVWNTFGQLASVTPSPSGLGGSLVASHHYYDAFGNRIAKTTAGNLFIQDGTDFVARVAGADSEQTVRLSSPQGTTLTLTSNASTSLALYAHLDSLGSTRAVTNDVGALVHTRRYDAFGSLTESNGSLPETWWYGFTGHLYDDDSGLVQAGGRFYNPEFGRFLNTVPVGQGRRGAYTWNKQAYALNNPLKYTDPTGFTYYPNYSEYITVSGFGSGASLGANNFGIAKFWFEQRSGYRVSSVGSGGGGSYARAMPATGTAADLLFLLLLLYSAGPPQLPSLGQQNQVQPETPTTTESTPPATETGGGGEEPPEEPPSDNACAPDPSEDPKPGAKYPSADELAKRLGTDRETFHRDVKPNIVKDFGKELRNANTRNPDIGIDGSGNVVLKNPQTGQEIHTGVPLGIYAP